MTKYFVDSGGNYLGGFDGAGVKPPIGSVEVQTPPAHALDKYVNGAWVSHVVQNTTLTPRQIRLVLNSAGLRDQVEAAVAASGSQDIIDMWEFSSEYLRDDPVLTAMAQQLGLTDIQLDDLFNQGAQFRR